MEIKIGNKWIGDDHPVFFTAEIGINHNGSVDIAKKLIDLAVETECDAVKFQKRNLNDLYLKKILSNPNLESQGMEMLIDLLKRVELSEENFQELKEYCDKKKILFLCSAWDFKSADFLDTLNIAAYKVASADMTNFPLLKHIASKKKPMIISTGMANLDEISRTVYFLNSLNAEFILLHCISAYPSPYKDLNLNFITTLKQKFNKIVGYSGHEQGVVASIAASALGARMIERHITLDKTLEGRDHIASLEPHELKELIMRVKQLEPALSNERHVIRGEVIMKEELAKSVVSKINIKKGQVIDESMISVKGPAKGLSPQYFYDLIGKVAKRDIDEDSYFLKEDLK